MKSAHWLLTLWLLCLSTPSWADYTLIPMERSQRDHLKAYGLAYWALQAPRVYRVEWLLNYRGGSFLIQESQNSPQQARKMGVSCQIIGEGTQFTLSLKGLFCPLRHYSPSVLY